MGDPVWQKGSAVGFRGQPGCGVSSAHLPWECDPRDLTPLSDRSSELPSRHMRSLPGEAGCTSHPQLPARPYLVCPTPLQGRCSPPAALRHPEPGRRAALLDGDTAWPPLPEAGGPWNMAGTEFQEQPLRTAGLPEAPAGPHPLILSSLLSPEHSRGLEHTSGGRLPGIRGCGPGPPSRWSRARTGAKDVTQGCPVGTEPREAQGSSVQPQGQAGVHQCPVPEEGRDRLHRGSRWSGVHPFGRTASHRT